MAMEGGEFPDYHLQAEQPPHEADIVPAPADRRLRQLFLDTGRALLLCGALDIISAVANPAANVAHSFVGFLLWILGVSILALLPAAGRFAPAVLVGVALASSLFKYFFTPLDLAI